MMLGKVTSMFRGCFSPFKSFSTSSGTPSDSRTGYSRISAASPSHENPLSGTRPGASPNGEQGGGAVFGMQPKEEPLAGYLLARTAMHRKVEGLVHQNLRAGHATLQEVAKRLPLGRGNVIEDIDKAGEANLPMRIEASYKLNSAMKARHMGCLKRPPKDTVLRIGAAVGQFAQTGTCGTFAAVSEPLHAAKLPAMKDKQAIVARVEHTQIDHAWSEMMPKGKGKDGKPIPHGEDVILDGWCKENLAILREDGEFSRLEKGKSDHLNHTDILDYKSGPKALKRVEKYKAEIENSPALKFRYNKSFVLLHESEFKMTEESIWRSTSVIDSDFRKQASTALHKKAWHIQGARDVLKAGKYAESAAGTRMEKVGRVQAELAKLVSLSEIQAIGVARSLGSNIRGANVEAPKIIDAARELFPTRNSAW